MRPDQVDLVGKALQHFRTLVYRFERAWSVIEAYIDYALEAGAQFFVCLIHDLSEKR